MNTPLSSFTWLLLIACAHTSRMWRLPVANTDLLHVALFSTVQHCHSVTHTDPLTISAPPVYLPVILMSYFVLFSPFLTLLSTLITQWQGIQSATRKFSMVTQTSQCQTNTMIMFETADQCERMNPLTSYLDRLLLHLRHIALWLPWNDVKNLFCGQELHNNITSLHSTSEPATSEHLIGLYTNSILLCLQNHFYFQHFFFTTIFFVRKSYSIRCCRLLSYVVSSLFLVESYDICLAILCFALRCLVAVQSYTFSSPAFPFLHQWRPLFRLLFITHYRAPLHFFTQCRLRIIESL